MQHNEKTRYMTKYIETHIYPLTYFLIWLTSHYMLLSYDMLLYSVYISSAYGIGHFLAARKGKVALSSDGTAIPLVVTAGIIYAVISWQLGHFPDPKLLNKSIENIAVSLSVSYFSGHALFFLLIFIEDKITSKG